MQASVKTSIKRNGDVYVGDKHIGRIESYEGSRTGSRNGRIIGQVSCKRWWAYDREGKRLQGVTHLGVYVGWTHREDAVAALVAALA